MQNGKLGTTGAAMLATHYIHQRRACPQMCTVSGPQTRCLRLSTGHFGRGTKFPKHACGILSFPKGFIFIRDFQGGLVFFNGTKWMIGAWRFAKFCSEPGPARPAQVLNRIIQNAEFASARMYQVRTCAKMYPDQLF